MGFDADVMNDADHGSHAAAGAPTSFPASSSCVAFARERAMCGGRRRLKQLLGLRPQVDLKHCARLPAGFVLAPTPASTTAGLDLVLLDTKGWIFG